MSETSEEQTCFCLSELSESAVLLNTITEQLPKIRVQYEKYKGTGLKKEYDALIDLQKAVKRLWEELPAITLRLTEYGDEALAETSKKLLTVLKKYDYLKTADYRPLCAALKAFADSLPRKDKELNKAALGHLMNRVKMGYFPTELSHVEMLRRAMQFPEDAVNLLDPCCGEGLALSCFAEEANAHTYGTEIDEARAEEAQKRIGRVGFGSFFHSRISLGAFQALFLNPPYLSVPSKDGSRRLEKAFLADSIRLLVNGGVMIYIIPYYRATPDVCRVLCENFENLRVYRFLDGEFSKFKQVVFLGTKASRHEAAEQAVKLSEYMLSEQNLPSISELPEHLYAIPPAAKPVELFKGAVFNVAELAEQLKKSKSINRLFASSILDDRKRRPLLPLNLSQIGLVGASGLMNGLIECDTPHVIKGRIVKEKKTKIGGENKYGMTEVREITSNRLIFNILTPDGIRSL